MNFKKIITLLKNTVNEFLDDNAMKFSASLSYYTVFALPPLSILIISISGFFFGEEAVTGEFYGQIKELVGDSAALQIQEAIKNVRLSDSGTLATIFGVIMLFFGASAVFAEIQSSINYIWGLKAKPNKGLVRFVKNRLLSFSMIASVGFLLLVSLIVNSVVDVLYVQLTKLFHEETVYLVGVVNNIVVFVIITLLFSIIFKTLPDGKIGWRETIVGSGFTSLFFMIGKFGIGMYLGNSSSSSLYGAAGSIIVILIWVYYSAIILYFGAEFTKVYAEMYGKKIEPNSYSVLIRKSITEVDEK
ncbi:YihY/virulence factor BrkB family protein [Flavobacterium sp. HSC-61S13]|uniref:YihY/virulence factor BrkB family protein n=1 Tax=Flavobacterium sp. HSC-61S13 TaxID=2910963 RepID=UPI00209EAA68|nr:YihY/virulence factor BrkB family protein [Flavobacterium sp. HSC-61S13]MCP1994506.1 membrane protein [Flavobacterium sp. HSC-61S13]